MREPTFWILTSLASAPRHGYALIQDAERLSSGRVRLQAGTLYAALDRLVAEGLVAPDREEIVRGRARRYYRLTDDGAAALDAEAARLQASVDAATAQLSARRHFGLGPAGTGLVAS
ncbi:PadR family transcriptional regulator [Actinoplanes sp. NBRC 103695]|uniref:PadR family transcriptional regulator n=1 Tax=Actinoplanes sp. NBRC 103695 TaxID=3032202 RepID=UPI0024A456F7|nr:PadR family transcriptional regulator [Actinoplanes sp. NBRC 103695]GLY98375.1 PadR family transcriptional regulator [Actinoplanes sp. NBRC 103695]